ncbi:MAG: AAA family ATPase [Clostridia bacterium]|nr:AAA family ATPase [Clostridia bacterium]
MINKFFKRFTGKSSVKGKVEGDALSETGRVNVNPPAKDTFDSQSILDAQKVMERLSSLVGLEDIKQQVEKLTAFAWMTKIREKEGITNQPLSLHMAFKGNPGTGKTTVARILGDILHSCGVLENSNVVEVSRSQLVGEYIGQSLPKVDKVIAKAKGGILLIDEAYSLVRSDSTRDYGYEVVDHLVKIMEDKRDEFMIIFTGYQKELDDFLRANTGLKSRINYHFDFKDYNVDELIKIFLYLAKERDYEVSSDAVKRLRGNLRSHRDNGRYIRNILEMSIVKKATNMYKSKNIEGLRTLKKEDITFPSKGSPINKIGFNP